MYYCPHCDDGPFSAADWWDHVDSHDNASWLQHRDPKNLDRTDLGYGEDLQRTTVPTHDMPNEKDVWNSVSPYGWHEDLTGQPFDGGLSSDPPGAHMGAQTIPDAHRLVWLAQPNDTAGRYWHHRPSNTTYAWGDSKHHIEGADTLESIHGDHPYFGHNPGDWEGGFWNEQSGKHPADLWGLPSSTDYASIQGDGDYGNTVW